MQTQNPTLQTWPQLGSRLHFYTSFHHMTKRSSSSQEQTDTNTQSPATLLCIQSEAGSFLRDNFLQNNMLTLQVMKGKGGRDWWLTHWMTYQPHLQRHNKNNWISELACLPLQHQLGNTQPPPVCTSASLTYSPYEKLVVLAPYSQGEETGTSKQHFFCSISCSAQMNKLWNSVLQVYKLWKITKSVRCNLVFI